MGANEKVKKAIEIFKEKLPEVRGRFRAAPRSEGGDVVEILSDGILYCAVNVRTGSIRI